MGKFISSKLALEFEGSDEKEKFNIPAGYIGDVPDWVTKTPLYKLATAGDNPAVTAVGEKKTTGQGLPAVSAEEKALRKEAASLMVENPEKLTLTELVLAIEAAKTPPTKTPPTK